MRKQEDGGGGQKTLAEMNKGEEVLVNIVTGGLSAEILYRTWRAYMVNTFEGPVPEWDLLGDEEKIAWEKVQERTVK